MLFFGYALFLTKCSLDWLFKDVKETSLCQLKNKIITSKSSTCIFWGSEPIIMAPFFPTLVEMHLLGNGWAPPWENCTISADHPAIYSFSESRGRCPSGKFPCGFCMSIFETFLHLLQVAHGAKDRQLIDLSGSSTGIILIDCLTWKSNEQNV